jgi:phospholipid-binding lipoprotein MlaA
MNAFLYPLVIAALLVFGCAHAPDPASLRSEPVAAAEIRQVAAVSGPGQTPIQPPAAAAPSADKNTDDYEESEDLVKGAEEQKPEIADPLEPFNRAMYHFNDKLYFWVLKPVAQGYATVVPEPARIGVRNFFSNTTFPIRFVNCVLQADFGGAASELGRFLMNTLWGIGGLLDPASNKDIDLAKRDEDFGQTLGVYGVGQGFFINWPILGPSSPRDTLGLVGDLFLQPLTYVGSTELSVGVKGYEKVNDTSLRIGDYESLKEAAIDPYVAIRDAYVQYRLKKVKDRGQTPEVSGREGAGSLIGY